MELLVLAIGVVFGVALIVSLVHFTGGSKPRRFASAKDALAVFQSHYRDVEVESVHLAIGGGDALVIIADDGGIAHLAMLGANPFIRLLSADDLADARIVTEEIAIVLPADGLSVAGRKLLFDDRTVLSEITPHIARNFDN
ncbi:MAG: hypothetical protein AAFY99_09105 [Pseudomonadota bacterium]